MIFGALTNLGTPPVQEGMIFQRTGEGAFVEKAEVLEVAKDKMGIPHVRFRVQVSRGTLKPTVENRTLALETFNARYRKN